MYSPPDEFDANYYLDAAINFGTESFGPLESFARQIARQHSLAGLGSVFSTLLRHRETDVAVTSHNSVMRRAIRVKGVDVRFCRASQIVAPLREKLSGVDESTLIDPDIVNQYVESLRPITEVHFPSQSKPVEKVLRKLVCRAYQIGQQHIAAAGDLKIPESEIWSCMTGRYAGRLIDIEARRRGQKVVRFSHGGAFGTIDAEAALIVSELICADQFVLANDTLASAARPGERGAEILQNRDMNDVIVGAHGDPVFDQVIFSPPKKSEKTKVLFVMTGFFEGLFQNPPVPASVVALDWRLTLIEKLRSWGVEVVVRPHPEDLGAFEKTSDQFSAVSVGNSFQDALRDVNILLFDWPYSTAFWEALCSGTPTILINTPSAEFSPKNREKLAHSLRVLPPVFMNDGKISIDWDRLKSAVLEAPWGGDPILSRSVFSSTEHSSIEGHAT
jgi:hypothetical protein